MKLSNLFKLNADKLSRQPLFAISLLTPFTIAFFLSIPLWVETEIDISSNGYNFFLSAFKLPIGVVSLSIPLVAIVAHIHRTIQTAAQIDTTRKKNTIDSFFSHHKFMIEAFDKIQHKGVQIGNTSIVYFIKDSYHLYHIFFEGSSYENGIVTKELENVRLKIIDNLMALEKALSEAKAIEDKLKKLQNLIEIVEITRDIERLISTQVSFDDKSTNRLVMAQNENLTVKLVTFYFTEKELKLHLSAILFYIEKISKVINIDVKIPDPVYFYANIDSAKYNYFGLLFREMILKKQRPCTAIALKTSTLLDEEFLDYSKVLR